MAERKTASVVTVYEITFRDGSTTDVEAKRVDFGERGAMFTGRGDRQGPGVFVAFVGWGDLRMVREKADG